LSLLLIGTIIMTIPEAPVAREPITDQCEVASAVVGGATIPATLSNNGVGVCGAVCFPTSDAADLIDMKIYSQELYTICSVDITTLQAENALLLEELQRPVPLSNQPSFNRWVGRGEGIVAGVLLGLAAWGVYQGRN